MISIGLLRDRLHEDVVIFDKHGDVVQRVIPEDSGPAALLVSPVTDAIKLVGDDGLIEESLDRDGMWSVDAIALSRAVLERLDDRDMSVEDLLVAVREAGFQWQVSPSDDL